MIDTPPHPALRTALQTRLPSLMVWLLIINGAVGCIAALVMQFVPTSSLPASSFWVGLLGLLAGGLIRARWRGGYLCGGLHFGVQVVSYFAAGVRWWLPSGFSLGMTFPMPQGTLVINFLALAGLAGIALAAFNGPGRPMPAVAQKS